MTTAATCTKEGVKTFTCSKCADKYTESIAKTAHNYAAATCTKPKTCSCGATSGSALGHSYTYAKNKAPTTSATGTLKGTCSRCSGTTSVTVPKLNTTDYTRTQTKAPTCTATGTYTWTWKITTYGTFSYTTSIAAKGHSWGGWEMTVLPTPVDTGKQRRTCSTCKTVENQTLAKVETGGNYLYIPDNYKPHNNQIGTKAINPRVVWWQDGVLYVQCFLINDTDYDVKLDIVPKLCVFNHVANLKLAEAYNFPLDDSVLKPGEYKIWTFKFSANQIQNYGASLNNLTLTY